MDHHRAGPSASVPAFRAAAWLDAYEAHLGSARCYAQEDLQRLLAADLEALLCCCAELPALAVPFMELLLSHRHLVEAAPQEDARSPGGHRRAQGFSAHLGRIRMLRRSCHTYLHR